MARDAAISKGITINGLIIHSFEYDLGELAPMVDVEAVISRNPEVMLAATDSTQAAFDVWDHWPELASNRYGNRFFVPALSPALQNLVLVLGGAVMVAMGLDGVEAALPWALLLLLGGALQCFVQFPPLWRLGWRPRFLPDLMGRHPETRAVL